MHFASVLDDIRTHIDNTLGNAVPQLDLGIALDDTTAMAVAILMGELMILCLSAMEMMMLAQLFQLAPEPAGEEPEPESTGPVIAYDAALAALNPIRYRGYYWDAETGYYFLQTRYYSPEWRRFLNADATFIAGEDMLNGSNMYAYCNGNPVMYADPTGRGAVWDWLCGVGRAIGDALQGIGEVFYTLSRWALDSIPVWEMFLSFLEPGVQFLMGLLPIVGKLSNWAAGLDPNTFLGSLMQGVAILAFPIVGLMVAAGKAAIAGCNFMIDAANYFSNLFYKMAVRITGGQTENIIPVDAEGYMLLGQNGETVEGASMTATMNTVLQGGGQINSSPGQMFGLSMGTNIAQVNLFHNATGSDLGLKSANLSVNLTAYPGSIVKEWRKSGTYTSNIALSTTIGPTNTVTANNGTAYLELVAYVEKNGNYVGTASVKVASIKMAPSMSIGTAVSNTFASPSPPSPVGPTNSPNTGMPSVPLVEGLGVIVIGYYENHYFIIVNHEGLPKLVFARQGTMYSDSFSDEELLNCVRASAFINSLRMLAAVTYGEVGDDRYPQDEWAAVAWSIRNRVDDPRTSGGWPNTYEGVLVPSQYHAMTEDKYRTAMSYYLGTNVAEPNSIEKRVILKCLRIAIGVRCDVIYTTDLSRGANTFHQSASAPSWAPNAPRAATPLAISEGGVWCHTYWIT